MLSAADLFRQVMAECAGAAPVGSPIFKKGLSTQIGTMITTHFPFIQCKAIASSSDDHRPTVGEFESTCQRPCRADVGLKFIDWHALSRVQANAF